MSGKHLKQEQGRLAGKRALVTGAGTGIGREIALEFARQGADVALHYFNEPGVHSAVKEIQELGRRAKALQADFRKADSALLLANRALKFLGGIECLVNNAGITMNRPFLGVKREQLDTLLGVNFRSPFILTQRVVEHMLSHAGGSICNIASVHGVSGASEHTVYAATKGAIIAWTRTLAVELAYRGIRVNAIAPGWVTVENYYKAIPGFNERQAKLDAKKKVPVAHYGLPLDIARLAAFLCSEDARYIVGQTIVADGGTSSLMSLMSDFRAKSSAHFGRGYVRGV